MWKRIHFHMNAKVYIKAKLYKQTNTGNKFFKRSPTGSTDVSSKRINRPELFGSSQTVSSWLFSKDEIKLREKS